MITYLPWSTENLLGILEVFRAGHLPIIDLEFSALCRHRLTSGGCLYCDSPTGLQHFAELSASEVTNIIAAAQPGEHLRWLYCCGLGEPTDDGKFEEVIEFAFRHGVHSSIFTNGLNLSRHFLEFLYVNGASLLIKCDSLNPRVFGRLLGVDDCLIVDKVYNAIQMAIDVGFARSEDDGCTRLALSVVPTKHNVEDIPEVVRFCKTNNLYPLLGQLEHAGRGKDSYEELVLGVQDLLTLKSKVETILGESYEIPVCPAGIAGIHINNVGAVIVHQATGLSCPWFDLEDPATAVIGNVRQASIGHLWQKVSEYRRNSLSNHEAWTSITQQDVFGGCGGSRLLAKYLEVLAAGTC